MAAIVAQDQTCRLIHKITELVQLDMAEYCYKMCLSHTIFKDVF